MKRGWEIRPAHEIYEERLRRRLADERPELAAAIAQLTYDELMLLWEVTR